jgi:hypothetical protein
MQAGPWEWWDSTTVVNIAVGLGLGQAAGTQIHLNSLGTNPDMSKAKGLAYIDSVQNYVNPRIARCLGLPIGIDENDFAAQNISVYPNPASASFIVSINEGRSTITSIEIIDLSGRAVLIKEKIKSNQVRIERDEISNGIYMLKIKTSEGVFSKQINLQ